MLVGCTNSRHGAGRQTHNNTETTGAVDAETAAWIQAEARRIAADWQTRR
ncbi:hypothetical protein JQK87_03745 [Streptomyces sp. G44]|nr:hypothetical protein [Streptomyces sp. G44]MBM7167538.1 hypothetical protein [Streptomyces sp. G44]